ncbi:MAG: CPBP family intramembrane glutamic endopeptidase [Myxococcales bacterium]|nr:CPBP family intramembrane metalloprotease [Myxococcota bacterium]MDW8284021.1 CPBP family intramembrane glutamic endopeptidase [Myxococcales bacterium]
MTPLERVLAWFPESWNAIDAQLARQQGEGPLARHRQAAQVLVLSAIILTFQWYWGDRPYFHQVLGQTVAAHPRLGRYLDLMAFTWWSAAKFLGFLLVPMLHVRLLGGRLADWGMPLRRRHNPPSGAGVGKWVYLVLLLGVLPLVVLASFTRPFQQTYPFYRQAGRSWFDFLAWELQYGATFLTVEFFFRGYLLFGLARTMGSLAIFVMVVPYCMLHYLKPAAESLGAIVAGVVLGTLALRTGTIWWGVLIHVLVAWSMDLLSSWQTGSFPPGGKFLP